jgi:subtilisin family serine protease
MKKFWIVSVGLVSLLAACPSPPILPPPVEIKGRFYPDPQIFETCVSGKVSFEKDLNVDLTGVEIEYDFGDNTGLLRTSNTKVSHVFVKAGTYTPNLKFFKGNTEVPAQVAYPNNLKQIVVTDNNSCAGSGTLGINTVTTYIVKLENSTANASQVAQRIAAQAGGSVVFEYKNALKGFAIEMDNKKAALAGINSEVDALMVDFEVSRTATQSPVAAWGLDRVDQRDLPLGGSYNYNQDGINVHAYIPDTGILSNHQDFTGRIGNGFSAINDANGTEDCNGHGTHVAGIVGGTTYGIAKKVTLHPIRVLNCAGSGSFAGVVAGIDWIAGNMIKPAVVNMSLGGAGNAPILEDAIKNTIAKGAFFVVSAGNSQRDDSCKYSPAKLGEATSVLTVGATDKDDNLASYTNVGKCVNIFAPGTAILSAYKGSTSDAKSLSGTSMAAPHVAGAAALYLAGNPTATPAQVRQALLDSATSGKVKGLDNVSPNKLLYITNSGGGGGSVSVTIAPGDQTMQPGEKRTFTAVVTGASNTEVKWEYGSGGTDSSNNVVTYTAPSTPGVYYLKATSLADPSKSAQVNITVGTATGGVSVNLTPRVVTLQPGAKQTFSATVTGSSNTSVAWEYGSGGTSGSGNSVTYTAPSTPGVYYLKATSLADRTKSASAIITVSTIPTTQIQVTISPSVANLRGGESQTFIASVTGTTNTDITWDFGGLAPAGARVVNVRPLNNNTAEFTIVAPRNITEKYQLTAISLADQTKKAQAIINITP